MLLSCLHDADRGRAQPEVSISQDCQYQDYPGESVHSGVMATTEFGHTVRRWRDRVSPEAAGLPVGGHRRAAGAVLGTQTLVG
jgi:hypothetical protein